MPTKTTAKSKTASRRKSSASSAKSAPKTPAKKAVDPAAVCLGVKVPPSKFLHEGRIARINAAEYEGQEIEGALHVVTPEDVVLEIGAGIGLVGAVIAKNAKPKSVHSFEANPELIPAIEELYRENDLEKKIQVRNTVLISAPDRPKTIPFHLHNSYLGSSLIDEGRARKTVDVDTADFAATCAEIKPTVLVMDIEGGELDLLRHADLSGFRAVVLEFHPKAYGVPGMRECKTILRDAGFARVEEKSTRTVWACVRR
ncbi:FkbM family methyltransferase [Arenibacterium sp. CAU 1754]